MDYVENADKVKEPKQNRLKTIKLTLRLDGKETKEIKELEQWLEEKTTSGAIRRLLGKCHEGMTRGWGEKLLK